MTSKHTGALILGLAVTLGACTSSGGAASSAPTLPLTAIQPSTPVSVPAPPSTTTASPTPEPSATVEPSPSGSADTEPTPVGIALDPCSLLTSGQASELIGVTLGAGKLQTVGPDKVCTWAKGLTEVKVFTSPPTDVAAAKTYYEDHKAEIPAGATITELPTFYDGSVIARASVPNISGIFVLDGNQFFEVYCGLPSCTDASLTSGADLVHGRLP
jgi:hypothetical protein